MGEFSLEDRDLGQGRSEIRVEGELDMAVAGQLQELIDRIDPGCEQLLIDLGPCEFIDSTGIAVILRAQRRRAEDGLDLAAYGAAGQARRVLEIAGLGDSGLLFERADLVPSRSAESA